MDAIVEGMALILGVSFEKGQLSPEEWALAREYVQTGKPDQNFA